MPHETAPSSEAHAPTWEQIDAALAAHDIFKWGGRADFLADLGLDWKFEGGSAGPADTKFGTRWVYCGMHIRVHSSGWCTVGLIDKIPLRGDTIEQALTHARSLGLEMVDDPRPCRLCGAPLTVSSQSGWRDGDGGWQCPPAPGKKRRNAHVVTARRW